MLATERSQESTELPGIYHVVSFARMHINVSLIQHVACVLYACVLKGIFISTLNLFPNYLHLETNTSTSDNGLIYFYVNSNM